MTVRRGRPRGFRSIPREERPREKIEKRGAGVLSEEELWMAVIGSGTSRRSVVRLAEDVCAALEGATDAQAEERMAAIQGLGRAKGSRVLAVLELMRRSTKRRAARIGGTEEVLPHIAFIARKAQEHLVCVSLAGSGEVLATRVVTIGLNDSTPVHPREVFSDPLKDRAAAVIIAHNHPSGRLKPGRRDLSVTRKLAAAGALLGIRLLDHIILAGDAYFSFRRHGLLR